MPIGANDWGVEKYRNKIKTRLISEKKMHSAVLGVNCLFKNHSKNLPHVHQKSTDLFIRGHSQTIMTRGSR